MYETVLREALSPDHLRRYLNADILRRIWHRLFLPDRIHRLWEERFPELRPADAVDIARPRTSGWSWTRFSADPDLR